MSRCAGGGAWPARELQLEPGVAGPWSGGGIARHAAPLLVECHAAEEGGRGARGEGGGRGGSLTG